MREIWKRQMQIKQQRAVQESEYQKALHKLQGVRLSNNERGALKRVAGKTNIPSKWLRSGAVSLAKKGILLPNGKGGYSLKVLQDSPDVTKP